LNEPRLSERQGKGQSTCFYSQSPRTHGTFEFLLSGYHAVQSFTEDRSLEQSSTRRIPSNPLPLNHPYPSPSSPFSPSTPPLYICFAPLLPTRQDLLLSLHWRRRALQLRKEILIHVFILIPNIIYPSLALSLDFHASDDALFNPLSRPKIQGPFLLAPFPTRWCFHVLEKASALGSLAFDSSL
jgi:hypothetical protein